MITVAVSGGFDPYHPGHVRHIRDAAKLGDRLIVILSRDDQMITKKGYYFMSYAERKEIMESIKGVDEVVQNIDKTLWSCDSLRKYGPDVYAKGGDRNAQTMVKEEVRVCDEIGCRIVYGVGGSDKPQSSSWLIERFRQ